MICSSGWQILILWESLRFVYKFQKNWIIAHIRQTDLLSKKKVVLESTSCKKFYNHNILRITSSCIFKKSIKCNICQSILNSSSYTSNSYWTLPRRHLLISNIAWLTKLFPKEKFQRWLCGYSNNTRKKIWHFSLIISVNEWVWLAQMLNYETTLCKMHLLHLKRS